LDWSGIRPESNLTTRDRLAGGTSKTEKVAAGLIWVRQDTQRPAKLNGARIGVTRAT
jgi:hypothetical protein